MKFLRFLFSSILLKSGKNRSSHDEEDDLYDEENDDYDEDFDEE